MVKETYLINEAAKEAGVEPHVLRYWEEELELHIKRNEQGHRIYTQGDIDRFLKIKELKAKGLQLKAIKNFVEDNPFAQKHITRLSKPGEPDAEQNTAQVEPEAQTTSKKMIEIKSIRSIMKPKSEEPHEIAQMRQCAPATASNDQTERLQYLFQKLIRDAVSANNEELVNKLSERISSSVGDDVRKELDYQFRLIEERDGERTTAQDKRSEEYYRKIDELLSQYRGKSKNQKRLSLNLAGKEKNDGTISFPLPDKEKEIKQKKSFHLFKKTPEAKFN